MKVEFDYDGKPAVISVYRNGNGKADVFYVETQGMGQHLDDIEPGHPFAVACWRALAIAGLELR